jgi:hypothetical protein
MQPSFFYLVALVVNHFNAILVCSGAKNTKYFISFKRFFSKLLVAYFNGKADTFAKSG